MCRTINGLEFNDFRIVELQSKVGLNSLLEDGNLRQGLVLHFIKRHPSTHAQFSIFRSVIRVLEVSKPYANHVSLSFGIGST